MGQLAVICNKKQAFCILIQTSYRKKIPPAILWHQFQNRLFPDVLRGAYIPGRLVQKIIHKFCPSAQALSAKFHHVPLRVYLQLWLFRRLTIYLNHSLLDQLLHFCPRASSGICQKFIQSHCFSHLYYLTFYFIPRPKPQRTMPAENLPS